MIKVTDLKIGMKVKLKSLEQLEKEGCKYDEFEVLWDDRVQNCITPSMKQFFGAEVVIDGLQFGYFTIKQKDDIPKYAFYPVWIDKILN